MFAKRYPSSIENRPSGRSILAALLAIGWTTGCGLDSKEFLEMARQQSAEARQMSGANDPLANATRSNDGRETRERSSSERIAKFVSQTDLPSPGRTNPFELSGGFQTEHSTELGSSDHKEIVVVGFVQVDRPAVMLSINGKTETLFEGASVRGMLVQEIKPPQVKLSLDGVSWYASLLDRRTQK
jgi:hypothetical protein